MHPAPMPRQCLLFRIHLSAAVPSGPCLGPGHDRDGNMKCAAWIDMAG